MLLIAPSFMLPCRNKSFRGFAYIILGDIVFIEIIKGTGNTLKFSHFPWKRRLIMDVSTHQSFLIHHHDLGHWVRWWMFLSSPWRAAGGGENVSGGGEHIKTNTDSAGASETVCTTPYLLPDKMKTLVTGGNTPSFHRDHFQKVFSFLFWGLLAAGQRASHAPHAAFRTA
jgi:hypothetical protein